MIIYKITNNINNKVYIGKAKNLKQRIKKHLWCVKNNINRYLYDAIKHYKWKNFSVSILEECVDKNANKKEIYYIKKYKSNDKKFGYNMTNGGDGGTLIGKSLESMIKKKTGRKLTEEHKKKISIGNKGKIKGNKNPAKRPEVRKKISETRKKLFKEGKLNITNNWMKGNFGEGHPMFGKHHSKKTKRMISKARKGKTYEEIFSKEKAKELKEMHRNNFLGNKINLKEFDFSILDEIKKLLINSKFSIKFIYKKYDKYSDNLIKKYFKQKFNYNLKEYRILFRKEKIGYKQLIKE